MQIQAVMEIDKVTVGVKEVDGTMKLTICFVMKKADCDEISKDTLFDLVRMQGQMVNVSFEMRQEVPL